MNSHNCCLVATAGSKELFRNCDVALCPDVRRVSVGTAPLHATCYNTVHDADHMHDGSGVWGCLTWSITATEPATVLTTDGHLFSQQDPTLMYDAAVR